MNGSRIDQPRLTGTAVARIRASALVCLTLAPIAAASADPVVPGATVESYAPVFLPAWMSFDDQAQVLFAGHETATAKIWRIGAGGAPVEEYGAVPIQDADAVLFDADGTLSGTPGSVLVGGRGDGTPQLWAILPDGNQTVASVFGPLPELVNISDMEFDGSGRLLFGDEDGLDGRVLESSGPGDHPQQLFAVSGRVGGLEVDAENRIYTATFDGRVRVHAADGAVLADPLLSGLGDRILPIAIGPGGDWGTDLYTVNQHTGELIRADLAADTTVVGTGFDGLLIDFQFGPDGALYVSDIGLSRIWRIAPTPTTSNAATDAPTAPFALHAMRPNPVRAPATIRYELPLHGHVLLRLFDVRGRLVRTLVDDERTPDSHTVEWDGRSDRGRSLASGVYFYRLDTGDRTLTRKLLLLP